MLKGAGWPVEIWLGDRRLRRLGFVVDGGPEAGNALYLAISCSPVRRTLVVSQGYGEVAGQRLRTPFHFFKPDAAAQADPVAICGWHADAPTDRVNAWSSADYAPSRSDCHACCVVLGERYPRRKR